MGPKSRETSGKSRNKSGGKPGSRGNKKADELARQREEEEERLRQEQLEKERLEKEKKEMAQRKENEKEEKKQRKVQLMELEDLLATNYSQAAAVKSAKAERELWERYMRCDGTPDPTISKEINTYLNQLAERQDDTHDVKSVFLNVDIILSLVNELEDKLSNQPPGGLSQEKIAQYLDTIQLLQMLLQLKVDQCCFHRLVFATDNVNSETGNYHQHFEGCRHMDMALWANLSMNPRLKHFDFEELGFNFEITKSIQQNNRVGVRYLKTTYDHLSPRTSTYRLKMIRNEPVKEKPPDEPEKKDAEEEKKDETKEENAGKEEDAEAEDETPSGRDVVSVDPFAYDPFLDEETVTMATRT